MPRPTTGINYKVTLFCKTLRFLILCTFLIICGLPCNIGLLLQKHVFLHVSHNMLEDFRIALK